ncbi:hypothetical protein BDV37DRAFT_242324 [Aspergillus pseudonomiae]|uniref:Uncharacterized protein n=1 Tax=Aspergillus pseudonomiae TaxID=1506151 RepID=A0A5N7DJL7_9EURO|nr:uncharacterized protein BDV37DRAFT_242324 [Aspergillus pseudonomiae]KAE8406631.1 hypothetical protein BDV37DRAFT_242324 [Aspergillus pseudonomiae]
MAGKYSCGQVTLSYCFSNVLLSCAGIRSSAPLLCYGLGEGAGASNNCEATGIATSIILLGCSVK